MIPQQFDVVTELQNPLLDGAYLFCTNADNIAADIAELGKDPLAAKEIENNKKLQFKTIQTAGLHIMGWYIVDFAIKYKLIDPYTVDQLRRNHPQHDPEYIGQREILNPTADVEDQSSYSLQHTLIQGLKRGQLGVTAMYNMTDPWDESREVLIGISKAQGLTIDLVETLYERELISPNIEMSVALTALVGMNLSKEFAINNNDMRSANAVTLMKSVIDTHFQHNRLSNAEDNINFPEDKTWDSARLEARKIWLKHNQGIATEFTYN